MSDLCNLYRCYVLELCKASLDKLFLEKDDDREAYMGPIPAPGDVLLQLANGLAYIHSQDLVHGALKPENALIWVGQDDKGNQQVQMKWADFGLRTDNIEGSGTWKTVRLFDSNCWLSPELLTQRMLASISIVGKPVDHINQLQASDVFSQGLVFGYFLSGGRHLFHDANKDIPSQIIDGHINTDYMASGFHFIILIYINLFGYLGLSIITRLFSFLFAIFQRYHPLELASL